MINSVQQCLLKRLKERKMKTMNYNLQKGIISSILVLIILTVGSAAAQSHENPTIMNSNIADATIHEASTTGDVSAELINEAIAKELSYQIENWMSNGVYWETDNSSEASESDLASEIESWMSSGSFWDETPIATNTAELLTSKIKSWMTNGSYWELNN